MLLRNDNERRNQYLFKSGSKKILFISIFKKRFFYLIEKAFYAPVLVHIISVHKSHQIISRNAQCTCIYHGWKMFRRGSKLRSGQLLIAVSLPSPRIVYITRQLPTVTNIDVLPTSHHSNFTYQFFCHCDSWYVGRTFDRLPRKIKQHVFKSILQGHTPYDRIHPSRSSQSKWSSVETTY